MTHLKKSLAMLLALIMMFSSMSVAATAWNPDDDPSDITFTVKFFRESPANSGNWIETTKAAPGENVKARVYVETGFYTYGGDSCFLFDKTFFSAAGFVNNSRREITVNENYAGPSDDAYGAGEYNLQASAAWKDADHFDEWNDKYDMDYILNEIEQDKNFFDTHEIISNNIEFGSLINNSRLTADDWMYQFDLVVNNNTATNTIDNTGEAEVPPYYCSLEFDGDLFIDFMKGESGAYRDDRTKNKSMFMWIPEFNTNPGSITTTSEIIFDMGLVDENGDWYEDTYTTEKGIIGTEADLNSVANPTNPDGRVFAYWSTQKPAEGVTQEKVSAISYDYDAQTLYAVWTDAPDVSYTLKEFYMNADGSYPEDVEGVIKEAAPNSKVSAEAPEDERYSLDMDKSDFDVVVNANGSSVVNAYYIRNEYNLVYHYEDMAGAQTDIYPVRFGAELPAFDGSPTGEPTKTGFTFLGWTTVEGGTTVETIPTVMPSEELHLYPVYEPHIIEFIFKSGEGTFEDGSDIKRYSFNYSADTTGTDFEEPTAPGKVFVAWDNDIPETATENMEFEAIYEDELYTVTFKADKDNDGEYETIVATQEFVYGEKLYTEFAPENYPVNVWKLENGTSVVISDSEDAYTVTGDVTLYTEGADEYPARFYWSEDDLANGAEPYDTIYVAFGESIPAPNAPEKAGYNFIAWDPDVESGLIMDSVDGMDFVAIFEAKTITVTFDPNGGTCDVESDSATYGESIEELPESTKDGYEFLGWYTPDGTKAGDPGDSYAVPTEDITLIAKWEGETHTITFLDDNSSELGKIEAETGEEITVPENLNPPVKEGHEFTGWTAAGVTGTVDVPEIMPADDMILTATWNKLSYAFSADANGGAFDDGSAVITDSILYDAPLAVEEPVWEGHEFLGWAYADDESNTIITLPETMPAEAINIKAVWDTNNHSITLNAGEGEFNNGSSVFTDSFDFGTDLTDKLPADPEREGYEFKGWEDAEGDIVDLPDTMPDEDISLTAKWEVKEYTITFDTDGGNDIDSKTYDFGETIGELPVPEKDGFEFAGWVWTNEDGETIDECETMPAHNITVTATWNTVTVPTYSVDYYLAVDGALYKSLSFEEGELIVHPDDPTVEGLTFTGWVDKDGNALPEDMVMGTEDIKVYAQFDFNSYKVTYIVDGEVYAEYDVLYQSEVPVPEDPEGSATRLFAGWSPAPESTMPARDLTYTATWADPEPDKYTATFLRADGKTHAKRVLAEGEAILVPEAPKKFGYVFVGWEPEVPATMPAEDMVFEPQYEIDKTFVTIVVGGTVVAGGVVAGSIIGAGIITGISIVGGVLVLVGVAELVKHTHTVTYIVDGEVYKTYKVVEGTKIPVPADPAKDGFIFEGWNPEVPDKMGKEDLVFEATWTEKSDDDSADVDVEIPETGSVAGGLAAFAVISGAAAAAYVITRKKKED